MHLGEELQQSYKVKLYRWCKKVVKYLAGKEIQVSVTQALGTAAACSWLRIR